MTLWSIEVTDNDLIRRVHPEKEMPPESWSKAWVNGLICFALMGLVLWGWR